MMLYVFNGKKIRILLAAALLFSTITAIIIGSFSSRGRVSPVIGSADAESFTLVIDAGHGGADGGAVAEDGMLESDVNLAIARRLDAIARLFGLDPVMTRSSCELDYPESASTISEKKLWDQKRRVELVNSTDNAVLISIHQNKFPDSRPWGAQVLYGPVSGSQEFGTLTHENLLRALNPENRRVAAPISDKIYLMRSVACPAILVECGFLSNPEEAALLASGSYQTRIAAVLFASYTQFIDSLEDPACGEGISS